MSVKYKLFFLVVILACFLRFFKLGSNPPSLYWDEASLGYNAYSIFKTGRDEHQERLPLKRFIAFGDYKPVGYIYFTVPSIAVFGVNEFAVRFPSALAGVLMVIFTFYLAKLIFKNKLVALIAAFLLAVSPWSLHLSRGAFEANLAALFNLLGIFFFFKGFKRKKYWFLSLIFFVLTCYTFNSNRVLTPILFFGLFIFYRQSFWQKKKYTLLLLVSGIILVAPLLSYLGAREARLRFDEVNVFSNLEIIKTSNERIRLDGDNLLSRIVHHRYLEYFLIFLKGYFSFFEPRFLLTSGDANPRLSSQIIGEIYLIELPFLLLGIFYLFKLKEKHAQFLCFWALVAFIPAATAREVPHALRALSILPVPQLLISFGLVNFLKIFKRTPRLILSSVFLFLIVFSLFYYQYYYYHFYPLIYSGEWQYGYKQMVQEVMAREKDYEKVAVTDYLGRPYIYFLFYKKFDPEKFWQTVKKERDWFGFYTVFSFDKYQFGDVNLDYYVRSKEKTLLVLKPGQDLAGGFREIKTISKLDGKPQFIIVEKL